MRKRGCSVWVLVIALGLAGLPGLLAPVKAAEEPCPAYVCCDLTDGGLGSVAQAEITRILPHRVDVVLMPTPVYCAGGLECSPEDFALAYSWATPECPGEIAGWEDIAQDLVVVLWVDSLGCLRRIVPVTMAGVDCDGVYVPLPACLQEFLLPTCATTYGGETTPEECEHDESRPGCAHAGQGGGLALGLGLGLALAALRRRPRRS
ncbi:MAG TPA: hypothetical protein PK668_17375 [Myxococcota bacterium]|nr:hypothetical protein [Myxococcota bacterium]HRY94932.1 hypothetical protein [Myxococcota bacterium]